MQFFIAGVQKGGTSALYRYLRDHPAIQMPAKKELHFFDNEAISWAAPDYEQLHRHFDWNCPQPVLRGEATPITLFWPHALERLRDYNSGARIIISLRHPSFRAFSQWGMQRTRGIEELSFEEAIGVRGRARVNQPTDSTASRVFSYVERGFYADQISRLLNLFPRQQIHFFRSDRLWSDPKTTLNAIQDFLGVERLLKLGNYVHRRTSKSDSMPVAARASLDACFRENIEITAALTGQDLSDWLTPAYEEPMTNSRAEAASRP